VRDGVGKGEASRSWCAKYLWTCRRSSKIAYKLVDSPKDVSRFRSLFFSEAVVIKRSPSTEKTMPLLIRTINNSHKTTDELHKQWSDFTTTLDRMSAILAWLSGLLYITARLILLAVAFAAFRKQNERLYIDTWARFLPSIG